MKLNSFPELLSGHLVQSRIDTLQDAAEGTFSWRNVSFSPAVSKAPRYIAMLSAAAQARTVLPQESAQALA